MGGWIGFFQWHTIPTVCAGAFTGHKGRSSRLFSFAEGRLDRIKHHTDYTILYVSFLQSGSYFDWIDMLMYRYWKDEDEIVFSHHILLSRLVNALSYALPCKEQTPMIPCPC